MARSGAGSRRKGYSGEIESSMLLQKAFYPDGGGKVIRTPMSGAWHGMPVLSGDVVFLDDSGLPDPNIDFFVEVKRIQRSKISPLAWLEGHFGILEVWLEQATMASKRGKNALVPIVMWRTDYAPWFIVFSAFDLIVLRERLGFTPVGMPMLHCHRSGTTGLVVVPFKDFIAWVRMPR